jgi:type III restriction enzyme
VLLPNDPDNYYVNRELVPADLVREMQHARIVITNYHAFKLRERLSLATGTRALLQGRRGVEPQTLETEGQMVHRVMPELMGLKRVLIINDEAHHCYRRKAGDSDEEALSSDERAEATKNTQEARLWISGIEAVSRKLGVLRVVDLSATPFFLAGSGYKEGTLFPWTMSDFSLMDAIECGIVKLPRVPVSDNIPYAQVPIYRERLEMAIPVDQFLATKNDHPGDRVSCHGVASSGQAVAGESAGLCRL